jgi:hypothetical protein
MKSQRNDLTFEGVIRLRRGNIQKSKSLPLVSGATIGTLGCHQGAKALTGLHHFGATRAATHHRSLAIHKLHGTQGHQQKGEQQNNRIF